MGIDAVKRYYDENSLQEWERLEQHPFEFIFTTYRMDEYIREGDSILDIGGGPGRYSIHYAKKGCDVTLVDLSDGNVALAREKAAENHVGIKAMAGNCLELDKMELGEYDHVFLMGPLYHLPDFAAMQEAVRQALRHLKPGGVFYCSFILEFAGILYDLKFGPGFLPTDMGNPDTAKLLDALCSGTEYTGPAFTTAFFIHPRQIEPFMSGFGMEKLHLFGQEGILTLYENQLAAFPWDERDLWIETAKKLLDVPELLSYSEHAMYIGRK